MLNYPPVAAGYPEAIPPKIQAAMSYLHFAESIRKPAGNSFGESMPRDGRELTSLEARTYDAALTTILEYFNSDIGFESSSNTPRNPPDDPNERERQPA